MDRGQSMCGIFVKRALVAALLIGPTAACADAPQDIQTAVNDGSDCGSPSSQRTSIQVHYTKTATGRQPENASPTLETVFCELFTA